MDARKPSEYCDTSSLGYLGHMANKEYYDKGHNTVLTASARKSLPSSAFAGPDRSYPIHDAAHARNALARVSQFGSPVLKAKVRAKVHRRYPDMGD